LAKDETEEESDKELDDDIDEEDFAKKDSLNDKIK